MNLGTVETRRFKIPALYLSCARRKISASTIAQRYNQMIIDMCGYSPNDSVYYFGKLFSKQLRDKYYGLCEADPNLA